MPLRSRMIASAGGARGAGFRLPRPVAPALLLLSLMLAAIPARAATPRVHAIVGARIVVAPGTVIPRGTVVIRDGVIVAVGADVAVPADARVWSGDSLTVYPGLIDAFVMPPDPTAMAGAGGRGRGPTAPPAAESAPRGAGHDLACVTPEWRAVENLPLAREQIEGLRAAGFAAAQVAPRRGVVRGQSAVIGLGDGAANAALVRADAAQVIGLAPVRDGYPGSLMGAIAVVRQAFLDARWYADVQERYKKAPLGKQRPEENLSWAALEPVVAKRQPALFVADEMLEVLRAGAIAREAGVTAQVVGAGDEYKRVKEIAALGLPLVVPVNYPEAPEVKDAETAREVTTEQLRAWDEAPGNAATLTRAGISFALTANGLKDPKTFRANVAKAIRRGLTPDQALAAVTTTPARLLGVSDRMGTIAAGKIANLTVVRGDLFSDKGKVRDVWVDGDRYEVNKDDTEFAGKWRVHWGEHAQAAFTVATDKDTTVRLVVHTDTLQATGVAIDGKRLRFTVQRGSEAPEHFDLLAANDAVTGTLAVTGVGAHDVAGSRLVEERGRPAPEKDEPVPVPPVMGISEAWRAPAPPQPAVLLVRNATVWTEGPQGTLENTDVLVKAGKIAAIGTHLAAPAGATVVDGTGRHVSPGIIDCHNHWAILGNVNECTNSVTSEVRIQDVINSESEEIYRELAGGVTMVHLLHGSCNSIGGQCAVIKMKWGAPPDQLFYAEAPPTIKFALGENPKQSNRDPEFRSALRYPQTRGGVEETIRDAFTRARDYRDAWAEWKAGKRPLPPRRDLQFEALQEILEGKRFIHCHSYRQDEILMLMRVAEEFGFRVGTFQHVLEGYKVADEMATHGAGGSTFSDWWAYKYEVIDAIPYNGYLMWDRGVTVSYNSDDANLARRLNLEAAKAIKYGGVPPIEALKFVTWNPAKQLHVESRVGSLEVGKDADFAIWSGSPLSPYSHCDETWIEGRKYFDRAADVAGRGALAKERDALIARVRASKKEGGDAAATGNRRWPPRYLEGTDMSGSECGDEGAALPFRSEAERHAIENGEVQR